MEYNELKFNHQLALNHLNQEKAIRFIPTKLKKENAFYISVLFHLTLTELEATAYKYLYDQCRQRTAFTSLQSDQGLQHSVLSQ